MTMPRTPRMSARLAVIACALFLAACSHSPTVQFYSLQPAPAPVAEEPLNLALAIGPVQFPRALTKMLFGNAVETT